MKSKTEERLFGRADTKRATTAIWEKERGGKAIAMDTNRGNAAQRGRTSKPDISKELEHVRLEQGDKRRVRRQDSTGSNRVFNRFK